MIMFLYGLDTYRSRQKLNEIIASYTRVNQGGLNLKYYDCKGLNFKDLKDELQQPSMFKGKKLIILTNFFSNPDFKKKLLENSEALKNFKDIILLFYTCEKIPEKDSLYGFLKGQDGAQEFKLLEGMKLKNWAKAEFEKYQSQISEKALEKLIEFIGNDLWQFSNEIKKLVIYKKNKKIEVEDVNLLVKPQIEIDIFKTVDAIASKNKAQALSLIHKHLEKGDSPLYLLSMILFQFRNLLIVKSLIENQKPYYHILKESQLHPFVAKKSYLQSNKFTFQELKKIYQKIFQIDLGVKTGKIEPEIAVDLLITEI